MHPSSIVPPPIFFKLAYASDGFYVRLVEAVVSFILDYKQLLIIFICASKFFLVLILTAPLCRLSLSPLPVTLPSAHFLANSSKRMSFWPAFPAVFLLHALLLSHCCIACIVCPFVCLSVCRPVYMSPSHFQDILLAALSLSPSPFHLLCRLLLLLLLPSCFCCCCLSRISTWSILAICWSAIISQWKAQTDLKKI